MKNIDERALAFVNMFAVLGSIPKLCTLDEGAAALAQREISVGFAVKNGPEATLIFGNGECRAVRGCIGPTSSFRFRPAGSLTVW